MQWRSALIGLMVLIAGAAQAEPKCTPTARVNAPNYPGYKAIPSTNNLLKPTGKALETNAQRLIISGHVVDSRCVPIQEAVVELWQMSPFGKWYLADSEEIVNANPVFAGAGRTVTDGEGYFTFITGFPGVGTTSVKETYKDKKKTKVRSNTIPRAPQVYVRIKARGFETFSTALFFDHDRRNDTDPIYKKISPAARDSVTLSMSSNGDDEVIGSKEIVLSGKAPYRNY